MLSDPAKDSYDHMLETMKHFTCRLAQRQIQNLNIKTSDKGYFSRTIAFGLWDDRKSIISGEKLENDRM